MARTSGGASFADQASLRTVIQKLWHHVYWPYLIKGKRFQGCYCHDCLSHACASLCMCGGFLCSNFPKKVPSASYRLWARLPHQNQSLFHRRALSPPAHQDLSSPALLTSGVGGSLLRGCSVHIGCLAASLDSKHYSQPQSYAGQNRLQSLPRVLWEGGKIAPLENHSDRLNKVDSRLREPSRQKQEGEY